jgi:predicted unusual protein kinase regulating ubiquinone biosynthesis (AarF/ABC1/UbiB family)
MDKEILKLLPQKAFKLLSIKETFNIGTAVTKSIFDKQSYDANFQRRAEDWKFDDIEIVKEFSKSKSVLFTKEDGEKILKIYFSQFFEKNLVVHIDLRKNSFYSTGNLYWNPSKINYSFSQSFLDGVCSLYKGFYSNDREKFEEGLIQLGMIQESMSETQKIKMKELFYEHFGEGRTAAIKFSVEKLQKSFNAIFTHFLKEDIPLNPEFAVLGVCLVTLYLTLQDIPFELNVSNAFSEVAHKYQQV